MDCIYCRKEISGKNKSREHVIPHWILRNLNAKNELQNILPISETLEVKPRRKPVANALTHNICSECNNNWLSDIDTSCMPLIKELINSDVTESINILQRYETSEIENLKILIYKIFLNLFATSPFKDKKLIIYKNFYESKNVSPKTNLFISTLVEPEKKICLSHLDAWNDPTLFMIDESASLERIRFKFFLKVGNIAFVMYNTGINIKPVGIDPRFLIPIHIDTPYFNYSSEFERPPYPVEDTVANRILWSLQTDFTLYP